MWVRFSIEPSDRHRGLTWAAMVGAGSSLALLLAGLPPIDLHPPWHFFGIMDPLCGGTRSARLTMHGEFADAWRYNPLGIVAVFAAFSVTLRTTLGATTGRWVDVRLRLPVMVLRLLWALAVIAVVALAVRQQQIAELLMAPG